MMPPSALSARLGAEPQCDWVDRQLDGLKERAQKAQHDLLIAGSRQHLPRCGLMAAQLPRGVQWGMALGRYPTTALRDVLVAIASVVVDDQIVEPMVRMGRRARRMGGAPDPEQPRHRHRRLGRLYEDGLVLMWGTGQAVLAAPLNAVVLGATLLGAACGAAAGAVLAVVVGLCTPRHLLRHLCPSLAILTHLTSNCGLAHLAAQERARQQKRGGGGSGDDGLRTLWDRINGQLLAHDGAIAALSGAQDGVKQARQLEQELLAVPTLSRFLGLGAYPLGNIDRLLQARATFDADYAALNGPSSAAPTNPAAAASHAEPMLEAYGGA
jgi:hypothetical protein